MAGSATSQMALAAMGGFAAGNQVSPSLLALSRYMATGYGTSPVAGGTLTINGQSLGSYDYTIKDGNQTISSFVNTDWFTTTADSRSAFIVVKGNLTINAGQTLIPSNRKLFTVVYVKGDLAISGSISMTRRGANHSAGGGNVTAAAIRIATGTFSGVSNPEVPASGGAGATAVSRSTDGNTAGNAGTAGTNGGTGGGGGGGLRRITAGTVTGGAGAQGTSFSGGSAGGSAWRNSTGTAGSGGSDGDDGGAASAAGLSGDVGAPGGAGNPAGVGSGTGTFVQTTQDGTGGVLIIICEGAFSGAGTIVAAGADGGGASSATAYTGSGGSGGGSVTVLYGSDTSSITPTAAGGAGGTSAGGPAGANGGAGGAGTARKLAL